MTFLVYKAFYITNDYFNEGMRKKSIIELLAEMKEMNEALGKELREQIKDQERPHSPDIFNMLKF